ncbi:MAG: DUF2914 domain-containing protein [Candidatus Paceibacterota bacterium]
MFQVKESSGFKFISHHWLTIAFVLGFITDFILLDRVDDKIDNAILFFYVVLATLSIILFYLGVADRLGERLSGFLVKYATIAMQYAFGGLLSGMLIFYGRSGDFSTSAPFLLIIMGTILVNELLTKRSNRLLYNVSVYFIGLFSYCVLIVPVWLGDMGDIIFVGSGLLALLITFILIKLLGKIIPNFLTLQMRWLVFIIGSIYGVFNFMYFLNIIPPIPLSLTELSIYQGVEKTDNGNYRINKEDKAWYQEMFSLTTTFTPKAGDGAYCFARVYAPTDLKTKVTHVWEYQDGNGDWQEHFRYDYSVSGENKNGYRGYTVVKSLSAGKWRCTVENSRGQVLGHRTLPSI